MNEAPIRLGGPETQGGSPAMEQIPVSAGKPDWNKYAVWRDRQKLIDPLKDPLTDVIILKAGTGTGKTRFGTQIALEALGPSSKIWVTENLRRATKASATTIAEDMGVTYGKEVGATNRYEHDVTKDTRLLFSPVQSLLIRLEKDPNLEGINMVAMDEIHKESKANEMCMIALRDLQKKRKASGKPLKLMFISATLDQDKISRSFPGVKINIVDIAGENIEVPPAFEKTPLPSYGQLPAKAAEKAALSLSQDKGNILVFMSGKKEIDDAMNTFSQQAKALGIDLNNVDVIPYYGTLPPEEQKKLFNENNKRKVVFCTNAAQESLTLDTHVVIDTTVHKHMGLDSVTGRQYLKQEPAPMSHLLQRKGRVGRIPLTDEQKQQGYEYKYYALCTEGEWKGRPSQESAEMQRTDLIHDALLMYADGYDPYRFEYINKPADSHIKMAVDRLAKLGALNNGMLTEKGKFMASFSLKPNLSSMVHASVQYGCARSASALAAILEEYPMAFTEGNDKLNQFKDPQSDLLGFLRLFNHFHTLDKGQQRQWAKDMGLQYQKMKDASDLFGQLLRQVQEMNPQVNPKTELGIGSLDRAIYHGFADSLLTRRFDGKYELDDIPGEITLGNESSLRGRKNKRMITFGLRSLVKGDTISNRIATLNHSIPDTVWDEMHPKEQPPTQPKPTPLPVTNAPTSTTPPLVEPNPAPQETPPPPPPTILQRFKNWLSSSWLGRFWKFLTK